MATPKPGNPYLKAFREGFARVHVAAPLVAVTWVVIAAALMECGVAHGGWGRLPLERVLRDSHDDWMRVTHRLSRLETARSGRTRVYVMGGSTAREMAWAPKRVESNIAADHDRAIEWVPLTTSAQTLGECLVMLDHLPEGGGVLLICINPIRFHFGPENYLAQARGELLRLPSPSLSAFLDAESMHCSRARWAAPGVARWINEIIQVNAAAVKQGQAAGKTYTPYRYSAEDMYTLKGKQKFLRTYQKEIRPLFYEHYEFNQRALDSVLMRARERGLSPVLLEMPLTPMAREIYQPEIEFYQEGARALAKKHDAPHLTCASDVAFKDNDFFDLTHLVAQGRDRYEPVLLKAVADVVGQAGGDSP